MVNNNLTAIILPGTNAPFIKNKPVIQIKAEITIRTMYNLLGLFCSDILVSAQCGNLFQFDKDKLLFDEIRGVGPIGTIISCLRQSPTQKSLILTADMPLVPAGLIHLLVNKKDEAPFVVPASGMDTIEPFCAIYDKSIVPVMMEMITLGDYNIFHLPQYCSTSYVQVYNGNNIFRNRNLVKQMAERR